MSRGEQLWGHFKEIDLNQDQAITTNEEHIKQMSITLECECDRDISPPEEFKRHFCT